MRGFVVAVIVAAILAMATCASNAALAWLLVVPLGVAAVSQPAAFGWAIALLVSCAVIACGDLASYVWISGPTPVHLVAIGTAPIAALAHAIASRLRKPGVGWGERRPGLLVVSATITAFALGCWGHHVEEDCHDPFVATTGERICDPVLITPLADAPLLIPGFAIALAGGLVALGRPRSVGAASAIAVGAVALGLATVPLVSNATRYYPTGHAFDLSIAMIGVGAVANLVAIRRARAAVIPRARVS